MSTAALVVLALAAATAPATLADSGPAGQSSEDLQYQPPPGATLVGDRIGVNLYADGGSTYARSEAVVLEPQLVNDANDFVGGCVEALGYCNGGNDLSSTFTLPPDRGGDLFVSAACLPLANQSCSQ